MLARSAEGLYWMGRYLERTDLLCRLLREQVETLVDRPIDEINFGWRRIYAALHRQPPGPGVGFGGSDDDYTLADSFTLADELTFERSNPDSLWNNFSQTRENARQMRHCISAEMWTCLNLVYLRIRTLRIEDIWKTAPESFYADIAHDIGTFSGVAETTMYRDQGWRFLQLGRYTERLQATTALLLAQLASVRQRDDPSDDDWWSLLRLCQALDAYTRCYGVEIRPERVLDLLVTDALLPRSLCSSSSTVAAELGALAPGPGPTAAAPERAGQLLASVHRPWSGQPGRDNQEDRLWRLLEQCRTLHDLIMAAHIRYDAEHAPLI